MLSTEQPLLVLDDMARLLPTLNKAKAKNTPSLVEGKQRDVPFPPNSCHIKRPFLLNMELFMLTQKEKSCSFAAKAAPPDLEICSYCPFAQEGV